MQQPSIYEPREDSFLLEKYVKQYAYGNVLDIGTGSGIQAVTASKKTSVKKVVAVDVQKEVIVHCKKTIKNKKIKFLHSDLFSAFNKKQKNFVSRNFFEYKFDTIIFNPPYLPSDIKLRDLTIDGGKKGYEVIERFLNGTGYFLKRDGIILLVSSSLTNKERISEAIAKNLLESKELEKLKIFFEELYVYKIKKSNLLKQIENKEIKNIKYFTKGHRGLIFIGDYKDKKVVIKIKNPKSRAVNKINSEAKYLKILNKKGIGPKLVLPNKYFLCYEFVEGNFILDYFKKESKKNLLKIISRIFYQLYTLDKLKINKEEMHHPYKHIIIRKNTPVMIDFERCHKVAKPKNVTQFCQFLTSSRIAEILDRRGIRISKTEMIRLAKAYKRNMMRTL